MSKRSSLSGLIRATRLPMLPPRPVSGHKGLFGKVLIIGGSEGMVGAPAFAALAALRTGCGLAYVAADAGVLPFVLTVAPEAVGVPVGRSLERLQKAMAGCDVVAVGPGLGQSSGSVKLLKMAMKTQGPMLIDADGLNLIAAQKVRFDRPALSTVLTPHPGEMTRLAHLFGNGQTPSDYEGRLAIAGAAAQHFRQVVLLKGEKTVITDGRRYAVNNTGDSTLAKAGSGDILSGMIAALLGQNVDPFEAAWLGAHYHGLAGELAGQAYGMRSALARNVIDAIPQALSAGRTPA